MKVATMEKLAVPPNVQKIERAFESFGSKREVSLTIPQQEHLRSEFKRNFSCEHRWVRHDRPTDLDVKYLREITEEEPPATFNYCGRCGAVSFWENERIWMYDGTAKFFGRPPKKHPGKERRQ